MALVRMVRRPDANADLKAVCAGIGTGLRTLHSGVLREAFTEQIADLLKQLDQATGRIHGGDSKQRR
jgi:hypothetical protein